MMWSCFGHIGCCAKVGILPAEWRNACQTYQHSLRVHNAFCSLWSIWLNEIAGTRTYKTHSFHCRQQTGFPINIYKEKIHASPNVQLKSVKCVFQKCWSETTASTAHTSSDGQSSQAIPCKMHEHCALIWMLALAPDYSLFFLCDIVRVAMEKQSKNKAHIAKRKR